MNPSLRNSHPRLVFGVASLLLTVAVLDPQARSRLVAQEPKERFTLRGNSHSVRSVVFSPDGKTLASASSDTTVKLWDVATGKERATLQGHTNEVIAVAFTPDGKILASGSRDQTVKLWDVATGKERATLHGHTADVWPVVFSPDGKTLASGSQDNTVKLWKPATGKERTALHGHTNCIYAVVFSPDGKALASGSGDRTVRLWEMATGKERASFQGHVNTVHSVAFSPDGKTLACGSGDTVKLWDIRTGKVQATVWQGHSDYIYAVAFSPDGQTLASGSSDKTVRLWDVSTGKEQAVLRGHSDQILTVAFGPDCKTVASGSADKTIKVWDMPALQPADKKAQPARSTSLSPNDLNGLWITLVEDDAEKAYQAIQALIGVQAVPLLKERLRPTPAPDGRQLGRWITDLDSDQFAIRQEAVEALATLGDLAEPPLREKLADKPPLETRQRIDQLLARIEQQQLPSELLRAMRAVEVLEHIGSAEAKQVLETLATGAEGGRLTKEAKASLERLNKRATAKK